MQLDLEEFSPCFLVASPQLLDPHFVKTVMLLIEYHDGGAVGIVINRPMEVTLGDVEAPDVAIDAVFHPDSVWYGGPVSQNHLLCLYESAGVQLDDATTITPNISLASSEHLLQGRHDGIPFPGEYRVMAGHAEWAPEQLSQELQSGSWLVIPCQEELIFSPNTDAVWKQALDILGVNPLTYHDTPAGEPN
jgi:putative transcriptional regulator